MSSEFDCYIHDEISTREEKRASPWNAPLIWTVLIILGLLVYEITARPVYGITIVCVKFGWNYFRSALWLLRADPNRQRGWACFWLYLAAALAKTGIAASILTVALVILNDFRFGPGLQPQGKAADITQLFLAYVTAFVAFPLSGLVASAAVVQALRRNVKLWLHPRVDRARKQKKWPPVDACRYEENKIHWLFGILLIFFFFPWFLFAIVFFATAMGQGGVQPRGAEILFVFLIILPSIGFLGMRDLINRRVIANASWECWREAELK